MTGLDDDFKKFFPRLNFKLKDFQKRAIENVLLEGNTLCIMPTGGGKSVIYQMAALELGGVALVVSPLIALMVERAEIIRGHGYDVLEFHSGIDSKAQLKNLKDFAKATIKPRFIFASPEKLAVDGFFEYCLKQRKADVKFVVIDEVHCVSQWGPDFRPFYKRIPDFLNRLFDGTWSKILALTATLNPKELADICADFNISRENVLIDSLLIRSEIKLHVLKFDDENIKEEKFWELLNLHRGEKILVYVYRKYNKRGVEDLCEKALAQGCKATYFHGDLPADERKKIIDDYKSGAIDIIFATNAFGMGIDIKNIRVVIHFMIPNSAEQFYQEIGRAARDGQAANSYLLYSDKNIEVKKKSFIDKSFPTQDELIENFKKIGGKIGFQTVDYFEDLKVQTAMPSYLKKKNFSDCLPYYLKCGAAEIVCKGFPSLIDLESTSDAELKKFFDGTVTYEEPLEVDGVKILPDFTIYLPNGRKIFWEHVGMLGVEKYDRRWAEKLDVYENYFPKDLRKTYESGVLSSDAQKIIAELQAL